MTFTDRRFGGDATPMAIGVVRGARDFEWVTADHERLGVPGPALTGVSVPYPWRQGENLATCAYAPDAPWWVSQIFGTLVAKRGDHQPPARECSCGFYAYFDAEDRGYANYNTVSGIIEGCGVVEFGERGFRCEKAKIVALINPYVDYMALVSDVSIAPAMYKRLMKFFHPLNAVTLLVVTLAIFNNHSTFYLPEWTEPIIDWWVLLYTLVYWPLLAISAIKTRLLEKASKHHNLLQKEIDRFKAIKERYPDIPHYRTFEEATIDHPLNRYGDLRMGE